jgi:hypothetical protein
MAIDPGDQSAPAAGDGHDDEQNGGVIDHA